jgi:phosphoesterase RecJ-like protein
MTIKDNIPALEKRVKEAQRVLVFSHVRPDGDAVGSLLGLGLALESIGKAVHCVLEDGVPKIFHHLPGADQVEKQPVGVYDLMIALDCSDISRAGEIMDEYGQVDVNIDHHPTNTQFARINIVDTGAVATAEMVLDLLQAFEIPLDRTIAEPLLTGIVTDTLGFRTTNVTPKALRSAAFLQETGADLPSLYDRALHQRSIEALKFWGIGLSKVQKEGRLIWTSLLQEDRKEANYPGRDDADLVNVLSSVEDTDVCVIFVEQNDGTVKVSWRADPGFDVSRVALEFGGGGHKPAAGATIRGHMERVQEDVLRETRKLL